MNSTRNAKNITLSGFSVAFLVMATTFWFANHATSYLPIVDGWAVLDRILHFDNGDMTWQEYLLRPHGAHLHSIVYLLTWVDYHYFNGQQLFLKVVSYAATSLVCLFFTAQIIRYGRRHNTSPSSVLITIAATVALITGIADTETMLHPFQVVLSVARCAYILLLWCLIVSLVSKNIWLYLVVMLLSLVAVSFHGTGYIFAALIVVAHIIVCRTRWQQAFCLMPFIATVLLQSAYSQGSGELSKIDTLLTIKALTEFFPAVFAYFVTPFTPLVSRVGTAPLLIVGFIVFVSTIILTLQATARSLGLSRLWPLNHIWQNTRETRRVGSADKESAFLAVLGIFVLASSGAAAVFWIIRNGLSGDSQPAFDMVFGSTRYGAFAIFSYVILMFAGLRYVARTNETRPSSFFNLAVHGLTGTIAAAAALCSILSLKDYDVDDQLNLSAAAISTGLSPLVPEAEGIWPGAKQDWYWVYALPETVATIKAAQKGSWRYLPRLSARATSSATYVPIVRLNVSAVPSDVHGTVCKISGVLAKPDFNALKKSALLPLVDNAETVVGYAVISRRNSGQAQRKVSGFALCSASPNGSAPLLMAMATAWTKPESILSNAVMPANITDSTWLNGVARNWAGYFVRDTPTNRDLFSAGRIVRFSDGKIRTVIRQEVANDYLNVLLTGKNLDGALVGYPHAIIPIN